MSNELAIQKPNAPLAEAVERVIVGGDLSQLRPDERLAYYKSRCEAAGLDPRTQPFLYLSLQGKLTLYAAKAATDQLIAIHKLTVEIVDRRINTELGIFEAQCRVRFPDGHHVEDFAALSIANLRGDALCNAMMKGITKSKRRTVLSACGLGMLDETEVETIPGAKGYPAQLDQEQAEPAKLDPPQNNSGFGRGQYASDADAEKYKQKMSAFLAERNARWVDRWTKSGGEIPDGVKDLCNLWQADSHLAKWAVETNRLDPASLDEHGKVKNRQIGKYTAIVYMRSKADQKALGAELSRYLADQESRQLDVLRSKHPELFDEQDDDFDDIDLDDEPANIQAPEAPPEPAKAEAVESSRPSSVKDGRGGQGSFLGDQSRGPYDKA